MIAASYSKFGNAADVLEISRRDIEPPAPGEVEVLIHYSGINPSDVKKRAGQRGEFPSEFVIPHSDGSGVIVDVGEGVSEERIGQNVWLYEAQHNRHWGTAAELVNLPESQAVKLPSATDLTEGACLGIPAMTAHRCLTISGDVEGLNVLITGAMGRVGYHAVQIAVAMGAKVIATVGSVDDVEAIQALGAELVLDFHDEAFAEKIVEHLGGPLLHRVVDVEFGVNLTQYLPAMADNSAIGCYASTKNPTPVFPFYDLMFKNISVHPIIVYSMPETAKQDAIDYITQMLEKEQFTHRVAKLFSLDGIVQAHEAVEQGERGCVLIELLSHD